MGAIQNSTNAMLGIGAAATSEVAKQKIESVKGDLAHAINVTDVATDKQVKQTSDKADKAAGEYKKAKKAQDSYKGDKRKKEYRKLKAASADAEKAYAAAKTASDNVNKLAEMRALQATDWKARIGKMTTVTGAIKTWNNTVDEMTERTNMIEKYAKAGGTKISAKDRKAAEVNIEIGGKK